MIQQEGSWFHLQGKEFSYLLGTDGAGRLFHGYFGRKLRHGVMRHRPEAWHCWEIMDPEVKQSHEDLQKNGFYYAHSWEETVACMDTKLREYPEYGHLDLRTPAYQIQTEDGSRITDLRLKEHKIFSGKPSLEGLPAVYDDDGSAQTLRLTLEDASVGVVVELLYTVFDDSDTVCRSARILNCGRNSFLLHRAFSMNLDLPKGTYDVVWLAGSWGRERHLCREPVKQTRLVFESARGGSSHQINPFVAVCTKDATEMAGEVWSANLVYSGNHMSVVEQDQYGMVRFQQGLSDETFEWRLEPGQAFQTPESVLCYSCSGFGEMSRCYHKLYRNRLIRGFWKDRPRPILINNWEATYFNFTEEKLLQIAQKAQELGIELFVLDDGWFGHRNLDDCSLGDWVVNREKLPNGIDGLARKVAALGMSFGLWMEPEMVNPDSDLYRKHPDWVIQSAHHSPARSRAQLVLDLSRKEVQEYIIEAVSAVLQQAEISYIKWDMNRHITDMPSAGFNHRYMLGLYRVLETITGRFPKVLFESCSGGGGRFDPGMLYYMPQTWTSDDTDAIERLWIQYGTSFCYPLSAMGAHVTAVPNHQTGRVTPLKTRGDVAFLGNFGYELDITRLGEQELEEIRSQVAAYKTLRKLMFHGTLYRLISPFQGSDCAFEVLAPDGKECVIVFTRILAQPNSTPPVLRLQGLDPQASYRDEDTGEIWDGDALLYWGIQLDVPQQDYVSVWKKWTKI